jgi:peptidyl-prolyl cis-trans isomerase SurA
MKLSRRMNLRFMTKKIKALSIALLAIVGMVQAQEVDQALSETDSTTNTNRVKLDGIAAVIGDYVILESDIDKTLIDLQNQGASTEDVTRCGLLGKLMEDRLYAHQAVQDSLLVSDDMVNAQSDRQIQQLTQQIGSVEKMLSYYKKIGHGKFP